VSVGVGSVSIATLCNSNIPCVIIFAASVNYAGKERFTLKEFKTQPSK
jgi:hypothetical protein